jgi:SAM-dependent methyltransferase
MYRGRARQCALCSARLRRFVKFRGRDEEKCPVCGSLKRHRLIWLYFVQRTNLFDGARKKMLHVAPEPPMTQVLKRKKGIEYLSTDLDSPFAMERMDITSIEYPDDSFDVIYCSHVLEHIPDDRKAMSEFRRVLRPGGWAILQVPIIGHKTFSDPAIVTPEERQRVYGHHDHRRIYGPDYQQRLESVGFQVEAVPLGREMGGRDVEFFGIDPDEDVYLCRKS